MSHPGVPSFLLQTPPTKSFLGLTDHYVRNFYLQMKELRAGGWLATLQKWCTWHGSLTGSSCNKRPNITRRETGFNLSERFTENNKVGSRHGPPWLCRALQTVITAVVRQWKKHKTRFPLAPLQHIFNHLAQRVLNGWHYASHCLLYMCGAKGTFLRHLPSFPLPFTLPIPH